jgi:L-lactate dehydrogenase complex protein LldG
LEAAVNSREQILHRVRTALGRIDGQAAPEAPPVRLRIPAATLETRIASTTARLEALAGQVRRVPTPRAAAELVQQITANRTAVVSNAPFLDECGIAELPNLQSRIHDRERLREVCTTADVGITSADYVLADTGTLVLLASAYEARMISLLPPEHIAVVPCGHILSGLDELLSLLPDPGLITSSMVLITGPSRTADIEQILVRGVHGPGRITLVLVG